MVHELIEDRLDPINNDQYLPVYAVYLDAVRHDLLFSEDRWPEAVYYLLNIYQGMEIGGTAISGADPAAVVGEINVTTDPNFTNSLNHSQIDDDPDVQFRILLRQTQLLLR